MRYLWFAVAILLLNASDPVSLHAAAKPKPPCKKIRDAVWAGRTLEQITKEFDTDAETVMKCTQKQGRRKADSKTQKKGTKIGSKSGTSTSAASTEKPKKVVQPTVRKPPAPRAGPWPNRVP